MGNAFFWGVCRQVAIKELSEQSAGVGGVGAAQLKMKRGSTGRWNRGEDACI